MPYTEMHPHTLNSAMYGFFDVNDVLYRLSHANIVVSETHIYYI